MKKFISSIISIVLILCVTMPSSNYAAGINEPKVTKIKNVSGGCMHSAAVDENGKVWTWGCNDYGQLGDGKNITRSVPVEINGISQAKSVSCGANHTLVLKEDGTVWAWGFNMCKQLGDGTKAFSRNTPVEVKGLKDIKALAGGFNHSVALKNDGTVWTWGRNSEGQLGRKIEGENSGTPAVIKDLSGIIAIAANSDYAAALKNDGTVWIWGRVYGKTEVKAIQADGLDGITAISALDNNVAALKNDGTIILWRNTATGGKVKKLSGFNEVQAISCSQYQISALKKDGTLWVSGKTFETYGLMEGPDPDFDSPEMVNGIDNVDCVASGYNHILILKKDGTFYGVGNNHAGQLGNGANVSRSIPTKVEGLGKANGIYACSYLSTAIIDGGSVKVWGDVATSSGHHSSPEEIFGLVHVISVTSTQGIFAGLKDNGTVWNWGANVYKKPLEVPNLNDVAAIAGGDNFDYLFTALKTDGTVWVWNGRGIDNLPRIVNGISGVSAISKGWCCTLVLKKDGTVWNWNTPVFYKTDVMKEKPKPVKIPELSGVVAISVSEYTALALKKDGTVWTWGVDKEGNLESSNFKRKPPVKIKGLSGIISISGCSTALKNDGTVWTWGKNNFGQLGNGSMEDSSSPVKVTGLKDIIKISSGSMHSLALDKNGTVWAWGLNNEGQLGDGIAVYENKPVQCIIYSKK